MKKLILCSFIFIYVHASDQKNPLSFDSLVPDTKALIISKAINQRPSNLFDIFKMGEELTSLSLVSKEWHTVVDQGATDEVLKNVSRVVNPSSYFALALLHTHATLNRINQKKEILLHPEPFKKGLSPKLQISELADLYAGFTQIKNCATLYQKKGMKDAYNALQSVWNEPIQFRKYLASYREEPHGVTYDLATYKMLKLTEGYFVSTCMTSNNSFEVLPMKFENRQITEPPSANESHDFKAHEFLNITSGLLIRNNKYPSEPYLVTTCGTMLEVISRIDFSSKNRNPDETFDFAGVIAGSAAGTMPRLLNGRVYKNALFIQVALEGTRRDNYIMKIAVLPNEQLHVERFMLAILGKSDDVSCMAINAEGQIVVGCPDKICLKYDPETLAPIQD